eukprot:COSAG06_NODE_5332_length_3542_cov_39.573337_1_plen_82_part_00
MHRQIDGNDHVVTDSIIFAYTSIGIEVNSPGTMLHNIHVWNGLHKVKGADDRNKSDFDALTILIRKTWHCQDKLRTDTAFD